MKRFLSGLLIAAALSYPACAEPRVPRAGDDYQIFKVDLDKDASPEKVGLHCTESGEDGWTSRLTVWKGNAVVWQSPSARSGLWAFGGHDWGVCGLEYVQDIDGDGKIEALLPEPVSDVSPVPYRIFRWDGREFRHVRTATLLRVSDTRFAWSDLDRGESWVGAFESPDVGRVWTYSSDGKCRVQKALLRPIKGGFQVVKWLPE